MNIAEIRDNEQGFEDKRKKNLRYKKVCGKGHVHVNETKTEIQAGPDSLDSQEIQGMGKGCVRPKEGTFFLHSL